MAFSRYPAGSVRQLLVIAFPLILSSLSGMAMLFVDRLALAQYTLEAHNAAVEATNLGWAFLAGWSSLASVTQIFVSQNFGAKQHEQLGRPVWQMIWLALFSLFIFLPLSFWGPYFFFGSDISAEMQRTYFFWMLLFGPAHGLFTALSGFFIGQGKTFLTGIVVFIGNVINTALCYLLVFGWEGYIPSFGIQGAAIATNTAVAGQVLILLCAFFHRSNRKFFGTLNWNWDLPLVIQCVRVGLPNALFGMLEVAGWAVFYKMMATLGIKHLTIAGIVQNVLILFFFFGDGLSKAVAAVCGNVIGAQRPELVFKVVRSGFMLITGFAVFMALFLWSMCDFIIGWFLSSLPETQQALFYSSLVFGLANAVIYKYLEGIRLVIAGALNASADTFFLMIGGSCSIWLFMVTPIYIFVTRTGGTIETALALCSVYTLVSASIYAWRFYSGAWQRNALLVTSTT